MCWRNEPWVRMTHVPTGLSALVRRRDPRGVRAAIVEGTARCRSLLAAMVAARLRDPSWRWTDANGAGERQVRTYVLWPYQGVKDHPNGLTSGVMRDMDPALFTDDPGPALDRIMLERRRAMR